MTRHHVPKEESFSIGVHFEVPSDVLDAAVHGILQRKFALTARQIGTFNFLAHGKSVQQISKLLQIKPRTVQGTITFLHETFGTHSREELTSIWLHLTYQAADALRYFISPEQHRVA